MGRRNRRKVEESKCDLTPMIDVVFQLIIFFIVTANLDQQSVMKKIKLPPSPNAETQETRPPNQISIQVADDGTYYIGSSPQTKKQLESVLEGTAKACGGGQNVPVLIRGDMRTSHADIKIVMDICAASGIAKIRFAGMKLKGQD